MRQRKDLAVKKVRTNGFVEWDGFSINPDEMKWLSEKRFVFGTNFTNQAFSIHKGIRVIQKEISAGGCDNIIMKDTLVDSFGALFCEYRLLCRQSQELTDRVGCQAGLTCSKRKPARIGRAGPVNKDMQP